jgi:hypothetical protein
MQQDKKTVSCDDNRIKMLHALGSLKVVYMVSEDNVRHKWQSH